MFGQSGVYTVTLTQYMMDTFSHLNYYLAISKNYNFSVSKIFSDIWRKTCLNTPVKHTLIQELQKQVICKDGLNPGCFLVIFFTISSEKFYFHTTPAAAFLYTWILIVYTAEPKVGIFNKIVSVKSHISTSSSLVHNDEVYYILYNWTPCVKQFKNLINSWNGSSCHCNACR